MITRRGLFKQLAGVAAIAAVAPSELLKPVSNWIAPVQEINLTFSDKVAANNAFGNISWRHLTAADIELDMAVMYAAFKPTAMETIHATWFFREDV